MNLSIITVTWNSKNLIGEQIASARFGCVHNTLQQIVVDNGSPDGTAEFVRSNYPDVVVIANEKNLGFAAANNQGLAQATRSSDRAGGEYLLFLNPDMRVTPGSLDTIIEWMQKHPDVGIASPKLVDEHGNVNRDAMPRRFPKLWEQLALILKAPHVFPQMLHGYHMNDLDVEREQDVDSVRGSFMLMRRSVVETLGWAYDPRYFFWYEDVDICREVKKMGLRVVYTPIISCVDYVGQSVRQRTTLWKQKQFTASMLIYYKKWYPWYVWMWVALLRPIGVGMAWLSDHIIRMTRIRTRIHEYTNK